ncbi:MAG: pantetheine-phosphate adenylyltransferase [Bacteroidota bacterium]
MKVGVFPGSFDPFTKGHESVVQSALNLFDEVVIAIGVNTKKTAFFSVDKRKKHIESLFENRVRVIDYQGLTVDLCKKFEAPVIIRGLRDSKDFEYEKSIAFMNRDLAGIETIFLLTNIEFSHINSSIIREIYANGGDISSFVTNAEILV